MKHNASKQMLKKLLCFFILTIILDPIILEAGRVSVRGYYRKDGTYVQPHYRTSSDGNPYNNYSYPGNLNPTTDKITTNDPEKYLDRYYRKQHSRISNETKLFLKGTKKNRGLIAFSTQSALKKLGYDAGPLDGIIGPKTRAAIRLFQLNKGLKTGGIFGDLTAKALLPYVSSSSQLEGKLTIIDGDTFYADGEKIRIYGFNAPELEELGGYLAKLRLEMLLSSGIVTIERKAKDKYGRTIAKVKINGIDLVSLLEPY